MEQDTPSEPAQDNTPVTMATTTLPVTMATAPQSATMGTAVPQADLQNPVVSPVVPATAQSGHITTAPPIQTVMPAPAPTSTVVPAPEAENTNRRRAFSIDSKRKSNRKLGFFRRGSKQAILEQTTPLALPPNAQAGSGNGTPILGEAPSEGDNRY